MKLTLQCLPVYALQWGVVALGVSVGAASCGGSVEASSDGQDSKQGSSSAAASEKVVHAPLLERRIAAARSDQRMVEIPEGGIVVDEEFVRVPAFLMDQYEVTNAEFETFVQATGFVSEAERIGNSVVFVHGAVGRGLAPFEVVAGVSWKHPSGPESDLVGKSDHPAVHISWNDAMAYAEWCGKRLATRNEWIRAASAGVDGALYPWGNELQPKRQYMMNCWQGVFPVEDKALDGYRGTSPVGSFPPNAFGLYDVAGNVWEWLAERASLGDGPDDQVAEKRGGSFLCREEAALGFHACKGYRVSSFEWSPISNGNDNIGFRCVRSIGEAEVKAK